MGGVWGVGGEVGVHIFVCAYTAFFLSSGGGGVMIRRMMVEG